MDSLKKKTYTTSRSLTYTYYVHAGSSDKPTVVLQHGFPDSAHLWEGVVPSLIPTGYPLLIPDLLGYAGTSKPTDTSLYNSKAMAADVIEICDAEGISSIVSAGHDWGSFLAQRLYFWHPDRVAGLILLNVAYQPPNQDSEFDLASALQMFEKTLGKPLWAYWEVFTAPDAPQLLASRLESFYSLLHGDEPDFMDRLWCRRGAMRAYLEADRRVPVKSYAQDPAFKAKFMARMETDGLAAPLQWYKSLASNVQFAVEKDIPRERFVVNKPVLFMGCTGDAVCLTSLIYPSIDKGLLPHVTVKEIESAHWSPMEKPVEVGAIVASFLRETRF